MNSLQKRPVEAFDAGPNERACRVTRQTARRRIMQRAAAILSIVSASCWNAASWSQPPLNPTPVTPTNPPGRNVSAANCQGIAAWAYSSCVGPLRDLPGCDKVQADTSADCEALAGKGAVHVVSVYEDGSFAPSELTIASGDTVLWSFYDRGESVIPVDLPAIPINPATGKPAASVCEANRPWDGDDPNEFTGPMPLAVSGIFLLNPERSPGDDSLPAPVEPSLVEEDFTGIALRIKWSDIHTGPGEFDWTYLDHLVGEIVDQGRLYSLVIKAGQKCRAGICDGTPEWIFDPEMTGASAATNVDVMSAGTFPKEGSCGVPRTLGSPADANYRIHYFEMLEAVAVHLKEKNSWYRSLAYIKPSGANLFSGENRLPNQCWSPTGSGLTADECDCKPPNARGRRALPPCVCNPQVWSVQGNYTPASLYDFYSLQTALLVREFPQKTMSYMLIQAGFPRVNNAGEYEGQEVVDTEGNYVRAPNPARAPLHPLPGGVEQTKVILERGFEEHGYRFAVQHNALKDDGEPNTHVDRAARNGQFTGYQTVNNLETAEQLGESLGEALDYGAAFVELYQKDLTDGTSAIPLFAGASLASWDGQFHAGRREEAFRENGGDPFPFVHGRTFTHTNPGTDAQSLQYVILPGCERTPQVGLIHIQPE